MRLDSRKTKGRFAKLYQQAKEGNGTIGTEPGKREDGFDEGK